MTKGLEESEITRLPSQNATYSWLLHVATQFLIILQRGTGSPNSETRHESATLVYFSNYGTGYAEAQGHRYVHDVGDTEVTIASNLDMPEAVKDSNGNTDDQTTEEYYRHSVENLSALLADKGSGEVVLLSPLSIDGTNPGKIACKTTWMRKEFSALTADQNVDKIIQVDPDDFSAHEIQQQGNINVTSYSIYAKAMQDPRRPFEIDRTMFDKDYDFPNLRGSHANCYQIENHEN